jgi:hypothetical protein
MIPLISIETTKEVSDPRPSPLEFILIFAPAGIETLLEDKGVSGSSKASLLAGGGAL